MRAAVLRLAVLTFLPCAAWAQGGNPLGPEFRVNTSTASDQRVPSVAADSSGNFVVAWQRHYGAYFVRHISGQRFASSGAPLGPEFRVNTYEYGSGPSIAADAAGNFVVVWQVNFLTGTILGGQRYASSGAPLGSQFALGTSGYYPLAPAAAADPTGNFVVVWDAFLVDGSDRAIGGQRYASSGVPLGSEFRVNTFTAGAQTAPSVAVDPSGNFVVVWSSNAQDGSGLGVFGQRYASSGSALGPEFRVNTFTTNSQGSPSVAADSAGNFVVVWQSLAQDGSGDGIFGQRYVSAGDPLGSEFRVNTFTTSDQRRPSLAADAAGNFVVVWQSVAQDGSNDGVFGQRYDSSGGPLGPEFGVNTYTTSSQRYPSAAADPSGDFVVVWQSLAQDGSGEGVFGQRYRPILPVELMQFRVE